MNIVLDNSHPLADQRLEKVLEEHGYQLDDVRDWHGETFFFYRETARPTTCRGGNHRDPLDYPTGPHWQRPPRLWRRVLVGLFGVKL